MIEESKNDNKTKKKQPLVLIKMGNENLDVMTMLDVRRLPTGLAKFVDGPHIYESVTVKGQPVFLVYKDQNFRMAKLVDKNNRSISPARSHCEFLELPNIPLTKTKKELYLKVFEEVKDYTGIKPAFCHVITSLIILTYAQHRFNVLPLLNLYGPTGSGKTACLILIQQLAYRSILETNLTHANILEHCSKGLNNVGLYTPSVSILEDEVKSIDQEKLNLLKSDTKWHSQSRLVTRMGARIQNTAQAFGLKVLAGEHPAGDEALQRRSVRLHLTSSRPVKNIYELDQLDEIRLNAIRGELLQWSLSFDWDFDYLTDAVEFAEYTNYWKPLLVAASGTAGYGPLLEFLRKEYNIRKQSKIFSVEGDIAAVIINIGIKELAGIPFEILWQSFIDEVKGEPKNSTHRAIILPEGEEISKIKFSKILRNVFGVTTETDVYENKVCKVLRFDSEELADALKKYTS